MSEFYRMLIEYDNSITLANLFEARVLADGGVFEAESCLVTYLDTII